jgi:hypothetical protein
MSCSRTVPPVTCTTPLPAKSRTPHPNSGTAPLEFCPRPAENMLSSLHTQCTISGSMSKAEVRRTKEQKVRREGTHAVSDSLIGATEMLFETHKLRR